MNQKVSIGDALRSMELEKLIPELSTWPEIWTAWEKKKGIKEKQKFIDLQENDEITDKNAYLLRRFIEAKWDEVTACYKEQKLAAETYYREILQGCKHVAAVDIGWAGSGAIALSHLVNRVWGMNCKITGIVAGTNTVHNAEPDASDPFLQDGRLVSYLYSGQMNRDLLKNMIRIRTTMYSGNCYFPH